MKKIDLIALLSRLIVWLLPVLMGTLGGTLLFSSDPGYIRGYGLTLIVLTPWVVSELLKERPTSPQQQKGRNRR